MSLEIWSFVVDVLSLIATVVLTVTIYWLQRSHEKEREQMEVEAQKKAVAEAARVFLIDNEDEIEYLPLSAIAKTLKLKRKHHRAITTKFLRCSEEVQKEILKQANFQTIEVSKEQVSAALKLLKDDIKTYCFGRDVLYGGAKYFHRAMERYSDEKIETVNPYRFEDFVNTRLHEDEHGLQKNTKFNITLYDYMYDYRHSGKTNWLIQKPLDMVWLQCDLAGCPEEIMTFWTMRIVIDCCRIFTESEEDFIFDEDLIETQEDMYYYAVMALYSTYIAKKVEGVNE